MVTDTELNIDLSSLSFENRSATEREMALTRHNVPDDSIIHSILKTKTEPFVADLRAITDDALYRRTAFIGQIAPTQSHRFQNRMSHIQHVAHVAKKLSRRMKLSDSSGTIAQAIAYAHDLGHAPFSHHGEHVFNQKLAEHGGNWDHDMFTVELITEIAHGGLSFNGLPLTNATLEGIIKRYKRYHETPDPPNHFNHSTSELPPYIQDLEERTNCLKLDQWNTIEGQIASISDWVAFTVSDTRDMLFMYLHDRPPRDFISKRDELLAAFPIAQEAWKTIEDEADRILSENPDKSLLSRQGYQKRMQTIIQMFSETLEEALVTDILQRSQRYFEEHQDEITHAEDVRELDGLVVQFSEETIKQLLAYRDYFLENVYDQLLTDHIHTQNCMSKFFDLVEQRFEDPDCDHCIPIEESWQQLYDDTQSLPVGDQPLAKRLIVAKHIATNFTDYDVLHFLKKEVPDFYENEISERKDGLYPQYPLTPPAIMLATLRREPLTNADLSGRSSSTFFL